MSGGSKLLHNIEKAEFLVEISTYFIRSPFNPNVVTTVVAALHRGTPTTSQELCQEDPCVLQSFENKDDILIFKMSSL